MKLISKIYEKLQATHIDLYRYIFLVSVVAIIPGLLLGFFVVQIADFIKFKYAPMPVYDLSWKSFWHLVVIAPILETYLLILTLFLLRFVIKKKLSLVIAAGVLWGLLHGMESSVMFFSPAWGFFILSIAYETWRLISFKKAFAAAALPHALNNLLGLLASGLDT